MASVMLLEWIHPLIKKGCPFKTSPNSLGYMQYRQTSFLILNSLHNIKIISQTDINWSFVTKLFKQSHLTCTSSSCLNSMKHSYKNAQGKVEKGRFSMRFIFPKGKLHWSLLAVYCTREFPLCKFATKSIIVFFQV